MSLRKKRFDFSEDENNSVEKIEWKNGFKKNLIVSIVLLVLAIVFVVVYLISKPDENVKQHDYFDIKAISELTSLQCRYHNIAVHEVEGGFLGAKKENVWFEYDVIVKYGIDVDKMKIEQPTKDGIVRIYMPPARIFNADRVNDTIKKPVHDVGMFNKLTSAEEWDIITDATEDFKKDAITQRVINTAYKGAKDIIEQYVINVGNLLGEDYRVEWVENPNIVEDVVTDEELVETDSTDNK